MTEAIHVSATALLPVALLPLLGARSADQAASPYGHPLIFLFIGGFLLALAMERWKLHRRIALSTLLLFGTRPRRAVAGFMLVTAALSMWVSNTATTAMMLPIAVSVTELVDPEREPRFATCLLLGVAYAASIGGIGTTIGTPTNLFLVGFARDTLGVEIGFGRWMLVGVPLVVAFLPLAWLVLTRVTCPVGAGAAHDDERGRAHIRAQLRELGRPSRGEWTTLVVFVLTAAAWIARPWLTQLSVAGARPLAGLTDTGIALVGGMSLFLLPVSARDRVFALDWATARRLPWDTLLLFGGGLSIAAAVQATGVGAYMGSGLDGLAGVPGWVLTVAVTTIVIFLTELTSNTATTATLLPILTGVAPALGAEPLALVVPAAIAASCAFMLPVATPPNAIVFGSGRVTVPQMMHAGLWLNLLGIVLVTALTYALALPLLR